MTVQELFNKVNNKIEENGFISAGFAKSEYMSHYCTSDKFERKEYTVYDNIFQHKNITLDKIYGLTLGAEVVYRHNGTNENQSVDIKITEWNENSGRRIYRERVNTKMSERQINNRVEKLINLYKGN